MHQTIAIDSQLIARLKAQLQASEAHYVSAEDDFHQRYPDYQTTHKLDALRQKEYHRLDEGGHIYLDYTGGGLYASSQLQAHMEMLMRGVYGNPHSVNPTSMAATELAEQCRRYVAEFFNADLEEYAVIFTPNASGALKLVGESYPFDENGQYVLTFDNHNSVNGIREFAHLHNAPVTYSPVLPPDLRIDEGALLANLDKAIPNGNNLFAYPAQSNFSGVQHDLKWITIAQEKGWDVLLDAAAFAPTNRLDLSQYKPDFVTLSFYKMMGYPTGVGALIARRDTLRKLHRPWFAGGTIEIASASADDFIRAEGEAAFEDGTIDYLNLPAVEIGLRHLHDVGMNCIHERVVCLTGYLLDELMALRHDNGKPLITLYGPAENVMRGGTLSMNFYDVDGKVFDYRLVEGLANEINISLRTGCFCNPGAGETAHQVTVEEMRDCFNDPERMTFERLVVVLTNHGHDGIGAVRVSVGVATNFADVYAFVQFAMSLLNVPSPGIFSDN